MKMSDRDKLTAEYQLWCKDHGYPAMSADELACEEDIVTDKFHRAWLAEFIARWERMEADANEERSS
jgi:hypothetical protein